MSDTYLSYMLGGDMAAPMPKEWEPTPRRVRTEYAGQIIADSRRVMMLRRPGHLPEYWFPKEDVHEDLLRPSETAGRDEQLGAITYWNIKAGGESAPNAAWTYQQTPDSFSDLAEHLTFAWWPKNKGLRWYEEDEEVFVHPRDPYSRIDIMRSSRHVRIEIGDQVIADSKAPHFLFETGLPTRFYLPRQDVQMDLLQPSSTITKCPYKGTASYWSVKVKDELVPDIAWSYNDPLPEGLKVKGLISFLNEGVDAVYVDDEQLPKPRTPWAI